MNKYEIDVASEDIAGVCTHYTLTAENGFLTGIYSEATGKFAITYFRVEPGPARRNGLGKELLRTSIDVAASIGASVVHATIISRESLEACRKVFGDDSIDIEQEGPFATADSPSGGRTTATLRYALGQC